MVTKVFASNMNTTLVPQSERSTVHRDERHFKLVFAKGIRYDDACDWIHKELGYTRNDIDSVMFKSLKIYEVEAKSEAIANGMKGKILKLRSQGRLSYDVNIEEYAPALTPLIVMGVPKVFPDSALQRLISDKLKTKIVRVSADISKKHQWYTGKRMYYVDTAVLKAANIPDSIAWNNGEWLFYLSYPGQEKKCRKCGEVGHYAKMCQMKQTPPPSDDENSDSHSEEEDDERNTSDENKVGDFLNGQKSDVIDSTGIEANTNTSKRQHSVSPNKENPGKIPALADDALHTDISSTQERRVYHYTLPAGKTAPQVPIRKMCDFCGARECVMEPSTGFYIAFCEKCDPLSLRATSKCFESACVVNKTWNKLPIDRERVKCANPGCTSVKFVCKCSNFHSVDTQDTRYECETCHECVDPPVY